MTGDKSKTSGRSRGDMAMRNRAFLPVPRRHDSTTGKRLNSRVDLSGPCPGREGV